MVGRGSWKSYCLVSALWALHFGCQRNRHYNNDSRSGAAIGRCWMPADWAVQSHSLPPGKKNGSICAADRSPAAGVLRKRLERLSGYGSSLVLGAAQCQLQKVSCLLNIDHTSPPAASIEQNTPKMQADSGQHRLYIYCGAMRWNTPDHRLLACFPCYVAPTFEMHPRESGLLVKSFEGGLAQRWRSAGWICQMHVEYGKAILSDFPLERLALCLLF